MSPDRLHAAHRGRRMFLAVMTSLASKAGSIALQFVAIPLAVRALGFEMFGVYATLTTTVGFLSLTGLGVGPGLTKAIAHAHARGDREDEQTCFTTAMILLTIAGSLAAAVVYGIVMLIPGAQLFGREFAQHQAVITACAPLLAALVFLDVILTGTERTQAAYQEMHRSNLWGAAGNFASGACLFIGIRHFPTVPFWIIAVYGVQDLCRLGNAIALAGWHRRYLLARGLRFDRRRAKELLGDGVAFTAAHSVAPLALREGGKLLASHFGGPAAAAVYSVLNQLAIFLGGFVTMFSMPLWPALMDAAARRDYHWFSVARLRICGAVLAYACVAGAFLTIFGTPLIQWWLGGGAHIPREVLLAFSCYYAASAWAHVNYVCLTGLGIIVVPGIIAVVEAGCALVAGWIAIQSAGMPGLLWGMTSVIVFMSAWLFPSLLNHRLKQWRMQEADPLPVGASGA